MKAEGARRIVIGVDHWTEDDAEPASDALQARLGGQPWLRWWEGPCRTWTSEGNLLNGVSFRVDKKAAKEAVKQTVAAVTDLLQRPKEDCLYIELSQISSARHDPRGVLDKLAQL